MQIRHISLLFLDLDISFGSLNFNEKIVFLNTITKGGGLPLLYSDQEHFGVTPAPDAHFPILLPFPTTLCACMPTEAIQQCRFSAAGGGSLGRDVNKTAHSGQHLAIRPKLEHLYGLAHVANRHRAAQGHPPGHFVPGIGWCEQNAASNELAGK